MTQFRRRGHPRTNYNGTTYWVRAHDVDREDWGRDSSDGSYFLNRLREIHADRGITSTFVAPNAECPVCGAQVFFYQNSFGSRVYFDELGKPWPKHPCTDLPRYRGRISPQGNKPIVEPEARTPGETGSIQQWIEYTGLEPAWQFWNAHQQSQWDAYRVLKRLTAQGQALLILRPISSLVKPDVYLRGRRLPGALKTGAIAFYHRGWLSYFDLDTMQPVDIELEKLRGSKEFVAALVGD